MSHRSSSSVADSGHLCLADVESFGQRCELPAFRSQCSHVGRVGVAELRPRIRLASACSRTCSHVRLVLGHRSCPKMPRIAARRVVAEMHDDGPSVEFDVMGEFIGGARSNRCPAIPVCDHSIPRGVLGSGPWPAGIRATSSIGVGGQSLRTGCTVKTSSGVLEGSESAPSLIVHATQTEARSGFLAVLDDTYVHIREHTSRRLGSVSLSRIG